MTKRYLPWAFAAVILSFTACIDNDIPDPAPPVTAGSANFSRYGAIGTSLTAGYADGGLYNAGMQAAFPNLLAGQFALAGGGSFTSPLFPGNQADGTGYLKLTGLNADGTPTITQVPPQAVRGQANIGGTTVTYYTKYTSELNNYGVPGIKVADLFVGNYGNVNGFYERLLSSNAPNNTTPYYQFAVTTPRYTFFTMELGSNDVLDYATSDGMTASRALTDRAIFDRNFSAFIINLSANILVSGIVATIPDVTVLPYFHYITLATLKAVAQKKGLGNAAIYIQSSNADSNNYGPREATDQDDFMLTFDPSLIGGTNPANGQPDFGTSISNPLPSSTVLDINEIATVQRYVNSYNNSIRNASNGHYTVFDAYALFNQLKNGVTQDGVTINTNFITGGVFSLDGIHLTPRGNAYVADEMIKVINTKYGSNLPALDISKYKGVVN